MTGFLASRVANKTPLSSFTTVPLRRVIDVTNSSTTLTHIHTRSFDENIDSRNNTHNFGTRTNTDNNETTIKSNCLSILDYQES